MKTLTAYFDCFSGASGDMILGALVDAGLPIEVLAEDIGKLRGDDIIRFESEQVRRCGLRATKVNVFCEEHHSHKDHHRVHAHRGLAEITRMILQSGLSERVRSRAVQVFERLAEAEAAVHGTSVEEVHFHEVGALDSIADIVGAVAGLERLGVDEVLFSTLRVGSGSVQTAHGLLPVPVPATARLINGFVSEFGATKTELLTPTAAAILTTLGKQRAPSPFRINKIGYGAGSREHPSVPNVIRVMIGETSDATTDFDRVWVLEANLDDTTPEICGYVIEKLLACGALDAFAAPIQMKKSRPGWLLSAITPEDSLQEIEEILFRETTTFGVRRYHADRTKLARDVRSIETSYGTVRVKVALRNGEIITASPEYDDCRRLAMKKNVPLRNIVDAARQEFDKTMR